MGLSLRLRTVCRFAASATAIVASIAPFAPAAYAQSGHWPANRVYRIGVLNEATTVLLRPAIVQSLEKRGLIDGKNLTLDFRSSMGDPEALQRHADALVHAAPDIIISPSTRPAVVLRKLTNTIPILVSSADPVSAGLVASLGRPGGNVTGMLIPLIELAAKRVELLHELSPGLKRIAIIWNPFALTTREQMESASVAARGLGIEPFPVEVRNEAGLEAAFAAIIAGAADAFVVIQDPLLLNAGPRLAAFALRQKLPATHPYRLFVDAGGLFSYGITSEANADQRAEYVELILKGAKPAVLPVIRPDRFDFVINTRTAQTLGIIVPKSVLYRATEVVQTAP